MRPAVFLDRDGTLNRERGYVARPAELEVLPGAAAAVRALDAAGWPVVVVTNQSGIAKGLYTEADLARVHAELHLALAGIPRGYFHCPHHPEFGDGAGPCACRKPADGLLRQAARVLDLSLDGSILIGDSARDLLPARAFAMRTVLVRSGKPWQAELARLTASGLTPALVADDLGDAVRRLELASVPLG